MNVGHATGLDLDRLLLDGLPAVQRAALLAHFQGCPRCGEAYHARLEAGRRFDRDVLPRTRAAMERRIRSGRRSRVALWFAPVLVAGLVLLAAVPARQRPPLLGVKGSAVLRAYARRGDQVTAVQDGTQLAEGDRIRFVLQSDLPYALLVAADGDGHPSVYFPHGGAASERVPPAAAVEVPGSIELDGARGPERIWALFSEQPLGPEVVDAVRAVAAGGPAALRATRTLAVPGTQQASLLIEKALP
jgi:hypothetical protein